MTGSPRKRKKQPCFVAFANLHGVSIFPPPALLISSHQHYVTKWRAEERHNQLSTASTNRLQHTTVSIKNPDYYMIWNAVTLPSDVYKTCTVQTKNTASSTVFAPQQHSWQQSSCLSCSSIPSCLRGGVTGFNLPSETCCNPQPGLTR